MELDHVDVNLIADAAGQLRRADEGLRLLGVRLSQGRRAIVARKHVEKARGYLADALYRLDLALASDEPSEKAAWCPSCGRQRLGLEPCHDAWHRPSEETTP